MPRIKKIYLDHQVAQLWGVDPKFLNSPQKLKEVTERLSKELKLTVLDSFIHQFKPYGLSLVLIISQSHLAIHTWPEYSYLHFDIVSCSKKTNLTKLEEILKKEFNPQKIKIQKIDY